jgi:hypothetical protein
MSITLTKYHALIQSFPLAQARLGMFKSGRYSGFDTMIPGVSGSGIPIKISHAGSVIPPVDNNNQWGSAEGVVLTPHGVVIKSSDIVELGVAVGVLPPDPLQDSGIPIVPGDANAERTDVVYLEFQWIADDLGFDPFIGVIQGTNGGGIPALGNARTQVAIGYIIVKRGATTINDLTYIPAKVPALGGANLVTNYPELSNTYAQLNGLNDFTKYQRSVPKDINLTLDAGDYIILDYDSNFYNINCNNAIAAQFRGIRPAADKVYKEGTRLMLRFYNVGQGSAWGISSNGNPPGFTMPIGGLSDSLVNLVRQDSIYEMVLVPNKTWWFTNMITSFGSDIKFLREQVAALAANQINATAKVSVAPYNGTNNLPGDPGTFMSPFFSKAPVNTYTVKYRINAAGDLEISGQFQSVVMAGVVAYQQYFLTLPPGFNPNRTIGFTIQRQGMPAAGGSYWQTIPAYLGYGGVIYFVFPSIPTDPASLFINLVVSFAS